ncbi:MAG: hypothetical protein JWQ43_3259 [Glaciihabitans sp.]|nr:hypothetical protein [Glaciihabitans sp.]
MNIELTILAVVVVATSIGTIITVAKDGYHRIPTRRA